MSWLQSFFARQQTTVEGPAPAVDVITYLASLASEPRSVDPILDNFRLLTARLKPGEALSPDDQRTLIDIYRKLETYLIKSEPLRIFDRQTLNEKIRKRFPRHDPAEVIFWKGITQE